MSSNKAKLTSLTAPGFFGVVVSDEGKRIWITWISPTGMLRGLRQNGMTDLIRSYETRCWRLDSELMKSQGIEANPELKEIMDHQ